MTQRPKRALTDTRTCQAVTVCVALLSALPSLVWALSSPELLTDDYVHLESFRRQGVIGAVTTWSFDNPARPLAGLYHLFNYGLIGDRPVLQALLLAALNAGLAAAIWLFGRRWLPMQVALGAAVLYAIIPNRGSSRLWFATGNYVLAGIVGILGCHLLFDRRRPVAAAATFAAAVLLMEGAIGLVAAGVAMWTLLDPLNRWKAAPMVAAPAVFALGLVYLQSPKRGGGIGVNIGSSVSTMGHGLFGSGLWGEGLSAELGVCAIAAAVALSLAALLPSYRHFRARTRWTRLGLGLAVIITAPMVAASLTFAVRGIFDRTNTLPMIGVSVLVASTLPILGVRRHPMLLAGLVPIGLYLFSLNLNDVRDYRAAARDGRTIIERVTTDLPADVADVIVFPPTPPGTGVAAFVYATDLDLALRLRGEPRGNTLLPWHQEQCLAIAKHTPAAVGYDWHRREVLPNATEVCARD